VVAIAPARRAVGGWLRIGRIEVEIAPAVDTSALPALTDEATRIGPEDTGSVLGQPMPAVGGSSLGPPTDWWTLPEGGVVVGWGDGETSLWVVPTGDDELLKKVAGTGEVVAEVPALGEGGIVVRGPHLFQSPHRRVAADTVVVWTAGDLTYRLEDAAAEPGRLLAIAEQLAATASTDRS
jgi:hypothetical protein